MCSCATKLLPGPSHNSCFSGSQDALITTNTKTVGIEPFAGKKGSLAAPQTRKSSARTAKKLRSFACPEACLHTCNSMTLARWSHNLRIIDKRVIPKRVSFWRLPKRGVTGFHLASSTEQTVAEIGPVAVLQRRRSFDRICIVFLQSLRTLRFGIFF